MSHLSLVRIVDPVLTTLARGYSNNEFVGSALFPEVAIEKEAGKVPQFGKEAFKIYNTERGLRAKSNILQPETNTTIDVVLTEHDISYPIDYREANEDPMPRKQIATAKVQSIIGLRKEYKQAVLANTSGNYPSGSKVALTTTACWSASTSTPISDIETGIETVRTKTGKRPNTMVLGATAFKVLKRHASIIDLIRYTMKGVVTTELLSMIFGIENVKVGDAIYSTNADVFADVWGDNCILAYVPKQESNIPRNEFEPSFGYNFHKKDMPLVDTYMGEGGKVEYVRSTDIFEPKIVGSSAGYFIENAVA
jgi:hypothetical protein